MRTDPSRTRSVVIGGLCGVLAGGAAVGTASLVAVFVRPQADPVIAVGEAMIDRTPEWLKEFAIQHFGTHDKQVLLAGLGSGVTVAAVLIGIVAFHRRQIGLAGLVLFGVVGAVAALNRPDAAPLDVLPSVIGAFAGMAVLYALVRTGRAGSEADRRGFLLMAGGAATVAVVSGGLGRFLAAGRSVDAVRRALRLPSPAERAPAIPSGADLRIPGLTPFTTGNADFYRVDTALVLPQVDPDSWTLRVHGMVNRPMELTFQELLRRPLLERDLTLTCVSNQVGGQYAGNARWLGVSLADLLAEAGVRDGADQVLSRSADGMTISTPLAAILHSRDALLAVGMNGEPLPVAHGFPVRMVVPGLYGYVSATKWLVELKVTTFAADRAYWTERGYADHAPIKTMSRIDVPKPLARVPAGRTAVAGVAWAQTRGVKAVQVRVDDGPWEAAELAPVPGTDTWRQWALEWNAAPGQHTLQVRATDATGAVQPQIRVPPRPDGATGWHSIVVTVE